MGNGLSIPIQKHVHLNDYPETVHDLYTVERTSGEIQDDWYIPASSVIEAGIDGPSAALRTKEDGWRIFMQHKHSDPPICGWRKITTVWPTSLHGNNDAIVAWREKMISILDTLEAKRIEKLQAINPGKSSFDNDPTDTA